MNPKAPYWCNIFIYDLEDNTQCTLDWFLSLAKNWEEWVMHQVVVLPFREPGLGGDLAKEAWNFNNGKLQVWDLWRNNSRHQQIGTRQLERSIIREDLGILMNKLKMSQQYALTAAKIHSLLASTRQSVSKISAKVKKNSSRLSLEPSGSLWIWYVIYLGNKCQKNHHRTFSVTEVIIRMFFTSKILNGIFKRSEIWHETYKTVLTFSTQQQNG